MAIECKFGTILNDCIYTCFPATIISKDLGAGISCFAGTHAAGKNNEDVVRFYLKYGSMSSNLGDLFDKLYNKKQITEYPKGINKIFPSLTDLTIVNFSLMEINKHDLAGLNNLKRLDLSQNRLGSLPNDLFINKKKLQEIDFSKNNLQFLTSKLLKPIEETLISADFKGNCYINFAFNIADSTLEQLMAKIDKTCTRELNMSAFITHARRFEKFLMSGVLSDFTIKVGESELKAHKNVLAAHSSVFAAMFNNEMHEKCSGELTITDFSISAIEDFLHFFYTGVVKSQMNAVELYALAWKYDVSDLKIICASIIMENIEDENAVEIFNLGHLHCCDKIKQAAFSQIEFLLGFDIKKSLMNDPQTLKALCDAKNLMDECREFHQK